MFEQILAKSTGKTETIREHTDQLLQRLDKLKEQYSSALVEKEWEILRLACIYHDVGKANTKFQNKIRNRNDRIKDDLEGYPEVPHNYLSCAYIPIGKLRKQLNTLELKSLLKAVYYHHNREEENISVSKQIINVDLPKYIKILQNNGFHVRDEAKSDFRRFINKKNMTDEELYLFVKIKGLLNKLDYAASADIDVEILSDNLTAKLENYFDEENYKKNELQNYLIENQDENHVVIASTGIGKTEAALFWVGDAKAFFTLPLKVSINSIYERIYDKFDYKTVGLLHSDTLSEYLHRNSDRDNEYNITLLNQTRQLAYPLTVCTIDQIIDFVALYPGFEMKLAVLSYSKLVIDEIQMYSPHLAALIILGLKHITEIGGKFLIMTATFPPLLLEAMEQLDIPVNMCKEPFLKLNSEGNPIARHVLKIMDCDININDVIEQGINKKVLIIVNTVKKAQELHGEFENMGIKTNLLHSRFIQKDRKQKEVAIEEIGESSCVETGIWITTQVVEASIDIDFDILFTELSEASGLFQRMGRVYRNRNYDSDLPNVFLYTGHPQPSGISSTSNRSVVDYSIYQISKNVLMNYDNQLISENDKMDIVEQIYTSENLKGSNYLKEFNQTLRTYQNLLAYELDGKPELRDISNVNIIPASVYRENEEEIQRLESILSSKSCWIDKVNSLTKLKEYTVQIPEWAFIKARRENLVSHVIKASKYESYAVLKFKYDNKIGLTYDLDENQMFL